MPAGQKEVALAREHWLYTLVGRRVQRARQQADLTQEELGKRVGLTRTSITNLERGQQKIQVHTLYEIAVALNVRLDALLPPFDTEGEDGTELQLPADLAPDERAWVERVLTKKPE